MTKTKRREGDFFEIKLSNNTYAYGRVLQDSLMAFYDLQSTKKLPIEEIKEAGIAFKVWVMDKPITTGRWPIIGNLPLTEELTKPIAFVNQDPISKRIYKLQNSIEMDICKEEALQLERAAVWSACHIEDRLADHFAGVENKWVKSLQVKID